MAYADDFNRANEVPLATSGMWTLGIDGGPSNEIDLESSRVKCHDNDPGIFGSAYTDGTQAGDQEARIDVPVLPGSGKFFSLVLGIQDTSIGTNAWRGYQFQCADQGDGTHKVTVYRHNAGGGFTALTSATSFTLNAGDTVRARHTGSTLSFYRYDAGSATWGSVIVSVSDSTYSGGHGGFFLQQATGRLDNFIFGETDVAWPPPTIVPDSVASAETWGSPTVLTSLIIVPDSVASDEAWGTPIVVNATAIVPDSIAGAEAFGTLRYYRWLVEYATGLGVGPPRVGLTPGLGRFPGGRGGPLTYARLVYPGLTVYPSRNLLPSKGDTLIDLRRTDLTVMLGGGGLSISTPVRTRRIATVTLIGQGVLFANGVRSSDSQSSIPTDVYLAAPSLSAPLAAVDEPIALGVVVLEVEVA